MVIEFKVFAIPFTFSHCSVYIRFTLGLRFTFSHCSHSLCSNSSLLRPLWFTGGLFSPSIVGLKTSPDDLLLITDHKCSMGLNAKYLAAYVNTDSKSNLRILKRR